MKKSQNPATFKVRDAEYNKMIQIYIKYGINAKFCYAETMRDIQNALELCNSEIVLCGIDHADEILQNGIISHNVHEYFEEHGINYIGSGPEIIERVLSKTALKFQWEKDGVQTPSYILVENSAGSLDALNDFPYLLKPENLGNSRGIEDVNIVWNAAELAQGVARMSMHNNAKILVEHYLGAYPDAMEITCAMIGEPKDMRCMPAHVALKVPKKYPLVTTADKENDRTELRPLSREMSERFIPFAQRAFESAGVRDYARGDFFFADGTFWAIEINGQPIIPDSWSKNAAAFAGFSEEQYLMGIIIAGYRRLRAQGLIANPLFKEG
jgi:D-alanine-D-alanine ligase-like ATP-grasp enzyme